MMRSGFLLSVMIVSVLLLWKPDCAEAGPYLDSLMGKYGQTHDGAQSGRGDSIQANWYLDELRKSNGTTEELIQTVPTKQRRSDPLGKAVGAGLLALIICLVRFCIIPLVKKTKEIAHRPAGPRLSPLVSGLVTLFASFFRSLAFRRGAILIVSYWLLVGGYLIVFKDYDLTYSSDFDEFCKIGLIPPTVITVIFIGFKKFWR